MSENSAVNKPKGLSNLLMLHGAFLIFSFGAVFQKAAGSAAGESGLLSFNAILFFGLAVFMFGIFALLWQIILRKTALASAFAHRGVVVLWGMLWGAVIFGESLNWANYAAAALIVTGIFIVGKADE